MHMRVDDQVANADSTMNTLSRPPRRYRLFGRCDAKCCTVRHFCAPWVVPTDGANMLQMESTIWPPRRERRCHRAFQSRWRRFAPRVDNLGGDAPTDLVDGRRLTMGGRVLRRRSTVSEMTRDDAPPLWRRKPPPLALGQSLAHRIRLNLLSDWIKPRFDALDVD